MSAVRQDVKKNKKIKTNKKKPKIFKILIFSFKNIEAELISTRPF